VGGGAAGGGAARAGPARAFPIGAARRLAPPPSLLGFPPLRQVVRIRGINGVSPKVKKILQILRLRQIFNATFVKINKATLQMLTLVRPYVAWGYPNLKTVKELCYKRGYAKLDKNRVAITDNAIIETELGKHNIVVRAALAEGPPGGRPPRAARRRATPRSPPPRRPPLTAVHGGPDPRNLHRGPALQGSQQLPLAVQALGAAGRPGEEAAELYRGRPERQARRAH
jgi:hypothetical protein